MHILFLGDGGSINTINWVRFYAQVLNHRITLVSFDPVPKPIPGVEVLDMSGGTKLKFFYRIPRLRRLIRELQPDLLLAYRVTSYGFTAACSGFHPLAVAAMGRDLDLPDNSLTKRSTAIFTIKRADLIHSWGENMTERLIELGANSRRILTLPRGVNTDLFSPIEARSNRSIQIISTRSLVPYYCTDLIMKAVAEVFQSVSEGGHTIIGDGPERRRLERLAEDLGIAKQVRFLGSVSYAEVAKELRSSDIYVSAVPTDGTSSSLLEAMACGIFPVVVDNAPNRLWIRHGYNGFLYPAGNISALAQLLASAIADPKLRADAATLNVKEVKKRADWKTNMKVMEERHLDLCGQTVLGNTRDFSGVK